ncbi:uncharacterized protein LOC126683250 [Mercurialis annua]|uniref:uncharacterized protein LOC126683250 n=1 Tax=Mercurialis annua TaxID=3986 RepID=UPI00215EE70B|nr:uncharacterized protein LOC126683250 [Mercurialis annua]
MRFFRRIAGFLGFVKEHQQQEEEHNDPNHNHNHQQRFSSNYQESGLPRKGLSVPVQVAVDRPQLGPLLVPSTSGDGGVQGLRWYAKRLKIDEDGDVADEFLEEVSAETLPNADKPLPKFQYKYNIRAAKIKNQVISNDGRIQQCVEHQGRLVWV